MNEHTIQVKISCPACKRGGNINFEESFLKNNPKGITAVKIEEEIICEHSFICYIDKNFIVRDSYACDFKIQLPQIKAKFDEIPIADIDFDMDIIKLNLMPSSLVNVIKGVLHKKKILLLTDQDFLSLHFLRFFQYIFKSSFNSKISIISYQDYKKNKKNYKEYLVLDGVKIIQDKEKIIKNSPSKIEQIIVQKFYTEFDQLSSLIIIKNEIGKISRIIQDILAFNNKLKEDETLYSKYLLEYLNKLYYANIKLPYLNFLLDVAETYFNAKLKRPNNMVDFFGLV